MNPVVKTLSDDHVIFQLTEDDLKKLSKTKLVAGIQEDWAALIMHEMCVMQATALVTTQADFKAPKTKSEKAEMAEVGEESVVDDVVCVSPAIQAYLIQLNDEAGLSTRSRNMLKKVIPDIINTCPVKRKVTWKGTKKETVVDTRDHLDSGFRAAERKRKEILARVPLEDIFGRYRRDIPMVRRLEAIREAANLFHAGTTTEPTPS